MKPLGKAPTFMRIGFLYPMSALQIQQAREGQFHNYMVACSDRQAAIEADELARTAEADKQAEALASQEAALKHQQQALAAAASQLQVCITRRGYAVPRRTYHASHRCHNAMFMLKLLRITCSFQLLLMHSGKAT